MPKVSFIIPCYYNEENIPVTFYELLRNEAAFPADTSFEYVFIDDGSKDNTYQELLKAHAAEPSKVIVIRLAGNVGSYNAILAGMERASGDCNVILAADLQDPPDLVPQMYSHWLRGIKFVIANRTARMDGIGERIASGIYHFLIRKFALPNVPPGGFDLVLFDKQLREQVVAMRERNTNTVYLLSWLDYEYVNIPYVRQRRELGFSRWTLQKKIKLFIDSFVSFSFAPIRAISLLGFILGGMALTYGLFIVVARLTGLVSVQGWAAIMVVILFVSAFQMVALGIIGEYVWRALDASRGRPNYVVDSVTDRLPPTSGNHPSRR